MKKPRDYKREYQLQGASKQQKDERVRRNRNRRSFERLGRVSKGDGKDISHVRAIKKGGGDGDKNLVIRSRSQNRANGTKLQR